MKIYFKRSLCPAFSSVGFLNSIISVEHFSSEVLNLLKSSHPVWGDLDFSFSIKLKRVLRRLTKRIFLTYLKNSGSLHQIEFSLIPKLKPWFFAGTPSLISKRRDVESKHSGLSKVCLLIFLKFLERNEHFGFLETSF